MQNNIKNTQNTFNQNKKKQIQNQMRKNNLLIFRGYFSFIALIIRFVLSMINSFGEAIFIRINCSPAVPYEKPRSRPTFASCIKKSFIGSADNPSASHSIHNN